MDQACSVMTTSKNLAAMPSAARPVNLFPWKLHEMLTSTRGNNAHKGYAAIVSWQPHGRAFRVHNKEAFAQLVMPRFFNQTKYKSFQRQLHLWGFKRIDHGEDVGAYFHMHFLRGQPDLCKYMRRHRAGTANNNLNGVHVSPDRREQPEQPEEEQMKATSNPPCFLPCTSPTPNVSYDLDEGLYAMNFPSNTTDDRHSATQQQSDRTMRSRVSLSRCGVQAANTRDTNYSVQQRVGHFFRGGLHESVLANPHFFATLSSLHPASSAGIARMSPSTSSTPNAAIQLDFFTTGGGSNSNNSGRDTALPASTSSSSDSTSSVSTHDEANIKSPPTPPPNHQMMPFPWKLHEMLNQMEQDGNDQIVSWAAHGRALKVHEPQVFAESIMPRYFRQTKFKSFQRQLNLWGFERVSKGPDKGCYFHPHFLRADKSKCKLMAHTGVKGAAIRRPPQNQSKDASPETSYEKPEDFIAAISDSQLRENVKALHVLIKRLAPELEPHTKVKGTLGYGTFKYHYKTAGRQGEWCKLGISYGKQITLHCSGRYNGKLILKGFDRKFAKAKVGLTSMRFQKLADLDERALKEIIQRTANADEEEMATEKS